MSTGVNLNTNTAAAGATNVPVAVNPGADGNDYQYVHPVYGANAATPTPVDAAAGKGLPIQVLNGEDVTQGLKADVAWTSGDGTVIAILKAIAGRFIAAAALSGTWARTTVTTLVGAVTMLDDGTNLLPGRQITRAEAVNDGVGVQAVAVQVKAGGTYYALQHLAPADAVTTSGILEPVNAFLNLYNGVTADRQRANYEATVYASAARTATPTAVEITNYNQIAAYLTLDLTAFTTTASLTVTVDYKDTLSGKYKNLITGAVIAAIGTTTYKIGPGLTAVANSVVNDYVPRVFRITVTHNNANSHTYSVSVQLIGQ